MMTPACAMGVEWPRVPPGLGELSGAQWCGGSVGVEGWTLRSAIHKWQLKWSNNAIAVTGEWSAFSRLLFLAHCAPCLHAAVCRAVIRHCVTASAVRSMYDECD